MESDPNKRLKNLRKHGIKLECCEEIFDGPILTRVDARFAYGEKRYISIGWAAGKIVVVVWAESNARPRLISCRDATKNEEKAFSKYLQKH